MTELYEFMSGSPWLTFCLACLCLLIVEVLLNFFLRLINRSFRQWNIRKYGYPPPHCDADGDFRTIPGGGEEEDENGSN